MAVTKITNENFETEVLQADKPVLLDFFATWCGPCKMLSPVVDGIAEEHSEIKASNPAMRSFPCCPNNFIPRISVIRLTNPFVPI